MRSWIMCRLLQSPVYQMPFSYNRTESDIFVGLAYKSDKQIAHLRPRIIPKGIATADLVAHIAVSKYADGLPLYRQENIFSRYGIELARSTMAGWMVKAVACSDQLMQLLDPGAVCSRTAPGGSGSPASCRLSAASARRSRLAGEDMRRTRSNGAADSVLAEAESVWGASFCAHGTFWS